MIAQSIKSALTLTGLILSMSVFALYFFILVFAYAHWDARYAFGIFFLIILFLDLFVRLRFVISRNHSTEHWGRKARLYAGFGTLYLLLPLVWTFSDDILQYYGYTYAKMEVLYTVDKNIILGTAAFNLACSMI
jgi:hypothetical protein